jgi:uncharacterized membrane protein
VSRIKQHTDQTKNNWTSFQCSRKLIFYGAQGVPHNKGEKMKGNSLSKILTAAAVAGLLAGTVGVQKASADNHEKGAKAEKNKCKGEKHTCKGEKKKDGKCGGEKKKEGECGEETCGAEAAPSPAPKKK